MEKLIDAYELKLKFLPDMQELHFSEEYDRLVAICELRLKIEDELRNHPHLRERVEAADEQFRRAAEQYQPHTFRDSEAALKVADILRLPHLK